MTAPSMPKKFTLEELLAGVAPENGHPEFDWGSAQGKEASIAEEANLDRTHFTLDSKQWAQLQTTLDTPLSDEQVQGLNKLFMGHDQMQESVALLRLLADSSADVKACRFRDSDDVFTDIRRMIAEKA